MRVRGGYQQLHDGERASWPIRERHKFACCDCGLVHLLKFSVKGSMLTMRAYRDNRATAQIRRHRTKRGH